ncbi:MAG: aminotransferase class V-fold PLP-dependent enzyme [bacterium]|nr:aminotransferase class V-fold PLP-dependent enzyme [bacterium]
MIYFNNAATGYPKPPEVLAAFRRGLEEPPFDHSRSGHETAGEDPAATCRLRLARLLNVDDPADIALSSGATESLNLAIFGLDLEGGHVITSMAEHNSVLRPLKHLERTGGIELSIVPCDRQGRIAPEAVEAAIRPTSKALVLTHCSNVTGAVNDLTAISRISRDHGLSLLIDASQSAGAIPIDIAAIDPDLLAFTGHKALYGPPGTGGLYISKHCRLRPLVIGGTGVRSDLLEQPTDRPIRYEAGTPNLPGIAALSAGVDFVLRTGLETIRQRKRRIMKMLGDGLSRIEDLSIYGNPGAPTDGAILSCNIPGMDPEDAAYILEHSFRICVRSGLHCAPLIHECLGTHPRGSIRISPSFFTSDADVDSLIEALRQISLIRTGA